MAGGKNFGERVGTVIARLDGISAQLDGISAQLGEVQANLDAALSKAGSSPTRLPRAVGCRFGFYYDAEVRAFIESAYGRCTLERVVTECRQRFGVRAPSRSSIGRYWQRLDEFQATAS